MRSLPTHGCVKEFSVPSHLRMLLCLGLLIVTPLSRAGAPAALDDRLVLELVAREPDIVTPTGIAVDEDGRVWVIENHTHHRPPGYQGPASDRLKVFEDFDASGRP